MAPLLIDGRDLLKLGIISVLVTLLVFTAGFLFGHQRAETFYQTVSETQTLSLPEPTIATEATLDSRTPEIVEAGETIDVDQPEVSILPKGGPKKRVTVSAKTNSSMDKKSSVKKKVNPGVQLAESQTMESVSEKNNASKSDARLDNQPAIEQSVNPAETLIVNAFSQDELNRIKYSVQVGMYVRLVNAENMMKMLQAQQFDAYVTDYTNKNDDIRYNVRFGYFPDKKSALEKLAEFKDGRNGDGYLVRFSADNIVKTAGVADVEQVIDAPVRGEESDKDLRPGPATVPSAIVEDKISQLDLSGPADALIEQRTLTN